MKKSWEFCIFVFLFSAYSLLIGNNEELIPTTISWGNGIIAVQGKHFFFANSTLCKSFTLKTYGYYNNHGGGDNSGLIGLYAGTSDSPNSIVEGVWKSSEMIFQPGFMADDIHGDAISFTCDDRYYYIALWSASNLIFHADDLFHCDYFVGNEVYLPGMKFPNDTTGWTIQVDFPMMFMYIAATFNKTISCFGYFDYEVGDVCNGHGNCFAQDSCSCFNLWEGNECELDTSFECFGKLNTDAEVCNGYGECMSEDYCQCNHWLWTGSECVDMSPMLFYYIGIGGGAALVIGIIALIIIVSIILIVVCIVVKMRKGNLGIEKVDEVEEELKVQEKDENLKEMEE